MKILQNILLYCFSTCRAIFTSVRQVSQRRGGPSQQHVPHNMTSAHVSAASSLTRESSGAFPAIANEIRALKS